MKIIVLKKIRLIHIFNRFSFFIYGRGQRIQPDRFAEKGSIFLKIKDEDEIFEMADSYMDALAEGSVKQYWKEF